MDCTYLLPLPPPCYRCTATDYNCLSSHVLAATTTDAAVATAAASAGDVDDDGVAKNLFSFLTFILLCFNLLNVTRFFCCCQNLH